MRKGRFWWNDLPHHHRLRLSGMGIRTLVCVYKHNTQCSLGCFSLFRFLLCLGIPHNLGTWLAQSVQQATIDLKAVDSSPTLGVEIPLKKLKSTFPFFHNFFIKKCTDDRTTMCEVWDIITTVGVWPRGGQKIPPQNVPLLAHGLFELKATENWQIQEKL